MKKKKAGLGPIQIVPVLDGPELKILLEDDPLSTQFKVPQGKTAKDLTKYLIAQQMHVYGEKTELTYKALERNFKLLLKDFTPEELFRAIALGARLAHRPFTTKLVKDFAVWVRESSTCPTLEHLKTLKS